MKKDYAYPSYELICRATSGEEEAVKEILDFYNAYIFKVCLRPCYHANGTVHMQVDEELKGDTQLFMCYLPYRFYCHIKAHSIVVNAW